jgi:cobalamin synthase
MRQLFRGFITGIRTLTIFPLPGRDSESFSSSLYWFPIIGGILGFLVYAAWSIGGVSGIFLFTERGFSGTGGQSWHHGLLCLQG